MDQKLPDEVVNEVTINEVTINEVVQEVQSEEPKNEVIVPSYCVPLSPPIIAIALFFSS